MSNKIATREAYGKALVKLGKINDDVNQLKQMIFIKHIQIDSLIWE